MQLSLLGAVNSNSHAKLKDFVVLSNILLYTQKWRGKTLVLGPLQSGATKKSSSQKDCRMAHSSQCTERRDRQ